MFGGLSGGIIGTAAGVAISVVYGAVVGLVFASVSYGIKEAAKTVFCYAKKLILNFKTSPAGKSSIIHKKQHHYLTIIAYKKPHHYLAIHTHNKTNINQAFCIPIIPKKGEAINSKILSPEAGIKSAKSNYIMSI